MPAKQFRMPAFRISVLYVIVSVLWIIYSDQLILLFLDQSQSLYVLLQTYKGIAFVLATGGALYLVVRAHQRKIDAAVCALEQRETQFRYLFQGNPVPMWVYDSDTFAFLDVNDAAIQKYGYTREAFASLSVFDICPEEEKQRLHDELQKPRVASQLSGEWKHQSKNGQVFYVEINSHLIRFNERDAVLVVAPDVTDRLTAEQEHIENVQLRMQLSKEAELRVMRNRFMSMVSHELRRPLTSISISADMLQLYSERLSDQQRNERLTAIVQHVEAMRGMLDEFINISKSDAARLPFHPQIFDLIPMCRRLIQEIQESAAKRHAFQLESELETLRISADPKLLQYIISNLITNAVKYSPENSIIDIEIWQNDQTACVRVRDQGIGIPKSDREHIFEPFYRASNANDYHGSGLGLAIVHEAVMLHRGSIEVEADALDGTSIVVRLPLTQPQPA